LSPSPEESARRREALAKDVKSTKTNLKVAFVWSSRTKQGPALAYKRGIDLAVDKINGEGGVEMRHADGRKYRRRIEIIEYDAPNGNSSAERIQETIRLAGRIGRDPAFVAVIGHSAEGAIPASIIYNSCGLPFLVSSTTYALMANSPLIFRVSPNNQQIARGMISSIDQVARLKRVVKRPKPVHVALLYPTDKASQFGPTFLKSLSEEARQIIDEDARVALEALKGPGPTEITSIDFRVMLTEGYDSSRADFESSLKAIASRHNEYNVVCFAERLSDVSSVKSRFEAMLANLEGDDPDGKTILDFNDFEDPFRRDSDATGDALSPPGEDPGAIAHWILDRTREKALILYERSGPETRGDAARRLAVYLQKEIIDPAQESLYRLDLVMSRSFVPDADDYTELIASIRTRKVDYIFISGYGSLGPESSIGRLIRQLRAAGVKCPILCGPNSRLFSVDVPPDPELWPIYAVATYDPEQRQYDTQPNADAEAFDQRYFREGLTAAELLERRKYETSAAYGWATIGILKSGFEMSQSGTPRSAAMAARAFGGKVGGILGQARISSDGGLDDVPILLVPIAGGSPAIGGLIGQTSLRPVRKLPPLDNPPVPIQNPTAGLFP